MKAAVQRSLILTGITVGFWLLLAGPAMWLAGSAGLEGLTIAAAICLVPGWLVFLFASGYGSPNFQAVAVLGGMLLRMAFVLVGTVAVYVARPDLRFREFFVWLLVFYLATLAVETALILKGRATQSH
jgi:hypothetical protein